MVEVEWRSLSWGWSYMLYCTEPLRQQASVKAGVLTRAMWGVLWSEKHGGSDVGGSADNGGVEGCGEACRFAGTDCSGEWKEILLIAQSINGFVMIHSYSFLWTSLFFSLVITHLSHSISPLTTLVFVIASFHLLLWTSMTPPCLLIQWLKKLSACLPVLHWIILTQITSNSHPNIHMSVWNEVLIHGSLPT